MFRRWFYRNSQWLGKYIVGSTGKEEVTGFAKLISLRTDGSFCNRINSSLTTDQCLGDGLLEKTASGLESTLWGVLVISLLHNPDF